MEAGYAPLPLANTGWVNLWLGRLLGLIPLACPRDAWRYADIVLICLWMHILWYGSTMLTRAAGCTTISKKVQSCFDMCIAWIELRSTLIRIKRVGCLIIATLIQCTEVVPYFRDIRVESDSPRVCIKCVAVLIDLIVEHANTAPEGWISTVTIDSLLVCLVRLWELLLCHVASAE